MSCSNDQVHDLPSWERTAAAASESATTARHSVMIYSKWLFEIFFKCSPSDSRVLWRDCWPEPLPPHCRARYDAQANSLSSLYIDDDDDGADDNGGSKSPSNRNAATA